MTITNRLKALITNLGGDASDVRHIRQGLSKLEAMIIEANPLTALTVDTDISELTDLFGKYVTDLQEGIVIRGKAVSGTLYFVDDYTGFSGDEDEQSGHYLVIHASVPDVTGVTIKIKISTKAGEKTLDSYCILILRVTEAYIADSLKLTFTASKNGYADYSETYDLTKLVLGPAKSA